VVARHLVTAHGVRHLVLASRSGTGAPGADALNAELTELGAVVRIVACDMADRPAVTALLDEIPDAHPLTAIVHTAGALSDALFAAGTPQDLAHTFAGKVDAAVLLHELTAERELAAFVLFSSVAGIVGSPGQAAYAAANTFLDALAAHRRRRGAAATSLAWGLWEQAGGMTAALTEADRARLARHGVTPLSDADGLSLFDAAVRTGHGLLVPARIDIDAPTWGSSMLGRPAPATRAAETAETAEPALGPRLAGLGPDEQEAVIVSVLHALLAVVVDHADARSIDSELSFKEIGLDSLGAVEFRNRVQTATGLKLPVTVALEYPTPVALARLIRTRLGG
jgi:acyl carrier protein